MTMNFNFMMPHDGNATKTFEFINEKWELKSNYKSGKYFKGFSVPIENLEDAYEILKENQEYPVFNIHGGFIEGTDLSNMIRRKRTDHKDGLKPTIVDRNLQLFCIDIDGYEKGDIEYFIKNELPSPFHIADYIYQFSSSYGLTKKSLNCHLFFWVKDPIHNLDLKRWSEGLPVDGSIYNAAQPIYIQKRICEWAEDPITDFIGIVKKRGELDWHPGKIVEDDTKPINIPSKYDLATGVKKILTSEDYHTELNRLALSLINQKMPAHTVKSMLKGAMESIETKDKRWQDRYDDIDRSVDSAVDIVNNPTLEEVLLWIEEEDPPVVKASFAHKCLKLSPMDRTTAVAAIADKIGFGVRDINKTIKLAEEEEKEKAKEQARQSRSREREEKGIYELEVNATNSGEVAEKASTILAKSKKDPRVFIMGGNLASVALGVPKTIRQCSKLAEMGMDYPKIPIVQLYRKPYYSLGGRLEKDVVFTTEDGKDIEPSTRVLHMIGEAVYNKFRPLTGIVEHPFVDNNWNIIQKEGYNETTGLYTMLHHKLKLTEMDPKNAYKYLTDVVFDEFPFSSELDKAVAVGALITSVQRPTIAGDSGMPGFGITSPVQSSGKTTLAQLISYAIFNRPVAASSWSNDEEELGKHLLAILQEGHSCVLFDNIQQGESVQSGRLANAMSNDIFGGRQLGENRTIEVPSSVVWLFTGNGIKFVGDFATRIYPININPNMQDPNTRVFKRDNIGQWAMDNRKRIISAVISIIKGGEGMAPLNTSSRFKLWDKFVRRPLLKASGIDINAAVENNQSDDPLVLCKHNLLEQMFEAFKSGPFTTRDLIKQAFGAFESGESDLGVALNDVLGNKSKNSMSIGRFLGTMADVVLGDYILKKKVSNYVYWRVIERK